jgi:hypothetical protein
MIPATAKRSIPRIIPAVVRYSPEIVCCALVLSGPTTVIDADCCNGIVASTVPFGPVCPTADPERVTVAFDTGVFDCVIIIPALVSGTNTPNCGVTVIFIEEVLS